MASSDRKQAANKQNASRSTGPRTSTGKRRASRNALRHGLAAAVKEPKFLLEIERLAEALLGDGTSPIARECARDIAAAHVDLVRVRMARVKVLDRLLQAKPHQDRPSDRIREIDAVVSAVADLKGLDRYERNALLRKRRAVGLSQSIVD
jgi:hypothetical protein